MRDTEIKDHFVLTTPQKNQPQQQQFLNLKFQRPTVSEYLEQLSVHETIKDQHVDKFCKIVWDAFVCMTDDGRNYLLKGLVERSSQAQIEFLNTRIKYVQTHSSGTDLLMKYQISNKVKKETVSKKNEANVFKQSRSSRSGQRKQELPSIENLSFKSPVNLKPKSVMGLGMKNTETLNPINNHLIGNSDNNNHHSDIAMNEDGKDTASNLYVKLLNSRYDHRTLLNHLHVAGVDTTKTFVQLLSRRCQKIEKTLEMFNEVVLKGDDELAINNIVNHVLEFLNARNVTVYGFEERQNFFWIKSSTWRSAKDNPRIPFEKIIGSDQVFNSHSTYSLQSIKSSILSFSDEKADAYMAVELDCVVCAPIISVDKKILGIIEVIDKKSGLPCFDAEDEFILRQLASLCAIVMSHNQMREESRRKNDDIQAILKTASMMSSALEIGDLIRLIMNRAQEILSAERVTLFLVDRQKQELWSSLAKGVAEIRIPINKGIAGHVATTGEVLNIPDAYQDPRFNREVDLKTGFVTRNILCMPIRDSQSQILGVTQIINKIPKSSIFTQNDELLLSAFSALAGATIEKSVLLDRTQSLLNETSLVKNNLSMILQSIADVVITLDNHGQLTSINHPKKLHVQHMMDTMTKSSYRDWLSKNEQMVNDIDKVYEEGETITIFDYELSIGSFIQSVNYTVLQLSSIQENARSNNFQNSTTSENKLAPVQKVRNGVVVVIELISYEKRLLSTLGRYMSSALANQIIQQGGSILGGQKQETTVLIADIRNFRINLAYLEPTLVVNMLNDYYTQVVKAISEENGILDKYLGDAALGIFGLPYTSEDDAIRAIKAALRLKKGLDALNALNRRKGRPSIQMGIGISTGVVISGNIGSISRSEYTIVGDNVRISTAMECAAKMFGVMIVVDERTKRKTEHQFSFRELDRIEVNKCGPTTVYEVQENNTSLFLGSSDVSKAGWAHYGEGLAMYRKGKWQDAISCFTKAIQIGQDSPSRYMVERCRSILTGEIKLRNDWDGSWPISM